MKEVMTFEKYVPLAMRTNPEKSFKDNLLNACLGLAGEYSEYENAETEAEKRDELSDLHWYTALFAQTTGAKVGTLYEFKGSLLTTIGRTCDYVKKYSFQGHTLQQEALDSMVTELVVCLEQECKKLGTTPSEIMEKNVAKLKKRYPQGFEVDRSVNRVE